MSGIVDPVDVEQIKLLEPRGTLIGKRRPRESRIVAGKVIPTVSQTSDGRKAPRRD